MKADDLLVIPDGSSKNKERKKKKKKGCFNDPKFGANVLHFVLLTELMIISWRIII